MTAGSLMCIPRSILFDRGSLVLSLRATALARPPFDPVDRIPDEPVMGWAASAWVQVGRRHDWGLSGSAALVVLYVTPLGLGEVEPAAGGGDPGAGPVQSSPIHALVQQGDLVHQVAEILHHANILHQPLSLSIELAGIKR